MDILEGGSGDIKLTINEEYAKKYTRFKDKQLLSKEDELLSDSSSSTEDENALLLNDKVQEKILVTLDKIKRKDPVIYDPNHVFFDDDDFEQSNTGDMNDSNQNGQDTKAEKLTYKDYLRKNLLEKGARSFVEGEEMMDSLGKSEKLRAPNEADEAKRAFLDAFNAISEENNDSDILSVKQKGEDEMKEDENKFKSFLEKRKGAMDGDIIARFWESNSLSKDDQFLRDYILNERWREDIPSNFNKNLSSYDSSEQVDETEEDLETAELFEHAYNYRYQDPQGRELLDTVRRVDERRKMKRERLKQRKLEEKKMRKEELKRIKEIKIKNANEKLKLLSKVTGIPLAQLDVNLDLPFDPESHEHEMNKMLGEDYQERQEDVRGKELLKRIPEIDDIELEDKGNGNDSNRDFNNDADEEGGISWWMCDYCGGGILEGHKRFDCEICENYTLCKTCVPLANHKHKLIRKRVPKGHQPPEEFTSCTKMEKNLDGLIDDFDTFEYEDILGGDLPVRFKYRNVQPDNFGLSVDQILTLEDKELKKKCSIKKLIVYT